MKIKLAAVVLAMAFMSFCANEKIGSEKIPIGGKALTPIDLDYMSFKYIPNKAVLYFNNADSALYAIKINSDNAEFWPTNPVHIGFVKDESSILIVSSQGDSLYIDNEIESVLGFGYIGSAGAYDKGLLVGRPNGPGLILTPDEYNPPVFAKCGCFGAGDQFPTNCTSGGNGNAIGCSVTEGGSVGIGWNSGCSIKCGSGASACCTRDDHFEF